MYKKIANSLNLIITSTSRAWDYHFFKSSILLEAFFNFLKIAQIVPLVN